MNLYHGSSHQQADSKQNNAGPAAKRQDPWMRTDDEGDHEASNHWLLSYLDVMTLLFCFFVMLFAWERSTKHEPQAATHAERPPATETESTQNTVAAQDIASQATDPNPVRTETATALVNTSGETNREQATEAPLPFMEPATMELINGSLPKNDAPLYSTAGLPEHFPDTIPDSAIHSAGVLDQTTPEVPATTTTPTLPSTPSPAPVAELAIPPELNRMVEVHKEPHAYRLEVSEQLLFAPAQAKLTLEGQHLIEKLVDPLRKQKGMIAVEGHTDNIPISNTLYPSNWELSSARATAVTRALIQKGIPARQLQAIGLADNFPKGDNTTLEGRLMNRRVSLVVQVPAEG